MIDRILDIQPDNISGIKQFNDEASFLAIEACAQLGAYHIRSLMNCTRHVFLMKIKHCEIFSTNLLSGQFLITAHLIAKSSDAYSYAIRIQQNNEIYVDGKFIFAVVDYDKRFQSDILMSYYQSVLYSTINNKFS